MILIAALRNVNEVVLRSLHPLAALAAIVLASLATQPRSVLAANYRLMSLDNAGNESAAFGFDVTDDGSMVSFQSYANGEWDGFVRDRRTETTEPRRASTA